MNLRLGFLVLVLFNSVATHAQDSGATSSRPCVANFSVDGSFFRGTTYKSWQEHDGVTYDVAFRKAAQAVALNGWGTPNANKDTGTISASQSVALGKGSTAPLNVVVQEKSEKKIRVEVTFSTGPGQRASEDTAREGLCKLVEAPGP